MNPESKMFRANVQITDFISLAVMLLMVVALISGQSGASAHEFESTAQSAPSVATSDQLRFALDGHIGDNALQISFAVVTELSQFRGEDE